MSICRCFFRDVRALFKDIIKMTLYGIIGRVIVKNEGNTTDVRVINNAQLELTPNDHYPKLTIKNAADRADVYEFRVADCAYVEKSSQPGSVECIRSESRQLTVMLCDTDKACGELLTELRRLLAGKRPLDQSRPIEERIQEFIGALNHKDGEAARRLASELARDRASVQFALDLINESGNSAAPQPVQPVIEPLRLKLSIESFLIEQGNNEQYDVSVLRGTTIKDLKDLVNRNTNIPLNHQYWYINRENLADDYNFGTSLPGVTANTVLILFITKPQEQ